MEHLSWTPEMWARIVWTDECTFSTRGFRRVYVNHQPEEKFEISCCTPKLREHYSWTIHGSISAFGKGNLVVIEKRWGGFTGKLYREAILPWVYFFLQWVAQHPENRSGHSILMEDRAPQHAARLTKKFHVINRVEKLGWPANSPDLDPIKNI
jgi:hypothetical protein